MTTPTMTWTKLSRWTRLSRSLGSDHNPLRRRSDLIAAWLLPGVLAAFLVLGPLMVGAAAMWVHAGSTAARQAQRSWHRVPAVLLRAAPGPAKSAAATGTWTVWTPARWTAGGRAQGGLIPAPAGTSAGRTVPVWLDRAGQVRLPPATSGQVRDHVVLAGSLALTALAMLLSAAALVVRRVLDRRRLAAWETAWLSAGPQWTGHG